MTKQIQKIQIEIQIIQMKIQVIQINASFVQVVQVYIPILYDINIPVTLASVIESVFGQ